MVLYDDESLLAEFGERFRIVDSFEECMTRHSGRNSSFCIAAWNYDDFCTAGCHVLNFRKEEWPSG